MIKNLVSFGCSWTYGDELMDPALEGKVEPFHWDNDPYRTAHAYPGLVAEHFGWSHEDLAWNGASLQSMLWNFNYWLDHSTPEHIAESIVIIGLTDESRISWHNVNYLESQRTAQHPCHQHVHSVWVNRDFTIRGEEDRMDEWRALHKIHYTLSDSDEWRVANYNSTVRAFDGIAARNNIPMLQMNMLTQNHKIKLPTLIESSSAMEMLVIRDKPRKDPLFFKGLHPNEKGHRIISEFLIKQIESAIINE